MVRQSARVPITNRIVSHDQITVFVEATVRVRAPLRRHLYVVCPSLCVSMCISVSVRLCVSMSVPVFVCLLCRGSMLR